MEFAVFKVLNNLRLVRGSNYWNNPLNIYKEKNQKFIAPYLCPCMNFPKETWVLLFQILFFILPTACLCFHLFSHFVKSIFLALLKLLHSIGLVFTNIFQVRYLCDKNLKINAFTSLNTFLIYCAHQFKHKQSQHKI